MVIILYETDKMPRYGLTCPCVESR